MNIEEKLIAISLVLKKSGAFKTLGINEEDHKPHQFTVGADHTVNVGKDGVMTEELLERFPCAAPGCKKKYSQHSSVDTLVLGLNKDMTQPEIMEELKTIKELIMKLKIDKVAFAESAGGGKFLK